MKLQAFTCPKCNAPLNLPTGSQDRRFIFCQYCGTKIMIDDIEFYKEDSKTERARIRADRDVRKNKDDRDAEIEKEKQKNRSTGVFFLAYGGFFVFLVLVYFVVLYLGV